MQARRGLADEIDWRVYFVTDTTYCGGLSNVPAVVEAAICGGAGVVQIRDKEIDDPTFLTLARACMQAAGRAFDACGRRAALVINDRLNVAGELGLHFHQGQDDGDIAGARRILGDELLIGLSVSTDGEFASEMADPTADVLGLSPIWGTPTKTDTAAPLGLDRASRYALAARGSVKTVAIGGINQDNVGEVIDTGVDGICVVSAIACAADPRVAAANLLKEWRN